MMPTQIEDTGLKKIFSLKKGHETARTVEWTGWIQSPVTEKHPKSCWRSDCRIKHEFHWMYRDVLGQTLLCVDSWACKGGQLRQKEPSPFSFTLSSSENSPEFRTALHDSTGNYQETEVHYQGFCFDDQGISTGKQTLIKRMIIIMYFFTSYNITWKQRLFLSRIYLPIYLTYLSTHPSLLYFSSTSKWNTPHTEWQGKLFSLWCSRTGILDSLNLTRNVGCVKDVIENKYYTYLKLQTTSHC